MTLSLIVVGAWLIGARAACASACSGRCRRSPTCSPRCARATTRSARAARSADDALGLALLEVNTLSETLRAQRLGALEATALLRRVMEEIDVAIFAFDGEQRLRLVNRGGERLLGQPSERLLGRGAEALGLATCLDGEAPRTVEAAFPGGAGRWELRAVFSARTDCRTSCSCSPT